MELYDNIKQGERGAWVSIGAYLLLSVLKIGIGYWTKSEALTADGINNTSDIVVSLAVLIGLKISRKPPDRNHPYGHMRAETIASMIASFLMMAAGLQVLLQAARGVLGGEAPAPNPLAALVALMSAVFMYGIYMYNRRLAEKINNHALLAAAADNRSDAFVSVGAAVGIAGAQFGWPWLDPVAAFAVGLVICKTAWDIFYEASHTLTDGFDEDKLAVYRKTIGAVPGVRRIKDLRARAHGSVVLIDVVVEVSPELNVEQSHDISDAIERRMGEAHRIANVHVHIEPYTEST
ncbi:cation diffusion facilitator family transporter [Paenibacillus hamazuiensis]|uniref:cation diffusion facilitator family transporter n=1 Tax=Paenibacillus hamazuiensis TaxID=2936508 RepID=UPI00200FF73D